MTEAGNFESAGDSKEQMRGVETDTLDTLRERARMLAARTRGGVTRTLHDRVVVARRSGVRLGLPAESVVEARRTALTRLHRAGGAVAGLFQLRGRVLSAVDLSGLLGGRTEAHSEREELVLVLEGPRGRLGLLVDEIDGVAPVYRDELDGSGTGAQLPFVTAVTVGFVHLIDVLALCDHTAIRVGGRPVRPGGPSGSPSGEGGT